MSDNLPVSANPIQGSVPVPGVRPTLDERIAGVVLSQEELSRTKRENLIDAVREKALGALPMGDIINTVINYQSEVEAQFREKKKEILFEGALKALDVQGEGIGNIVSLLKSPHGLTLASKIIQIADDSPPDVELLRYLSAALAHIATGDAKELFTEHRFALGQIASLTPQAISLIASHSSWPTVSHRTFMQVNERTADPWHEDAAAVIGARQEVQDPRLIKRLEHTLLELDRAGLIYAVPLKDDANEPTGQIKIRLTEVGTGLLSYLEL